MPYSKDTKQFLSMMTADDVATFFGITYAGLAKLIYQLPAKYKYTELEIPKKTGGKRRILAPCKQLKLYQRKIADVLLEIYHRKPPAHGFVKRKSIVTNAEQHLNKRIVFNIDFEGFFDSIHFGRVKGLFEGRLFKFSHAVSTIVAQICTQENRLPQGAPTSPILTNLIAQKLDGQLLRLARAHRCTYTRYVDDLTFSFTVKMNRIPQEIVSTRGGSFAAGKELTDIVEENGFYINAGKTRLRPKTQRQEVTGITVNERLNVRRQHIRQIRSMLNAWQKFGFDDAEAEYQKRYARKFRASGKPGRFENVLRGRINYVGSVRGRRDRIFVNLAQWFNQVSDSSKVHPISYVESTSAELQYTEALIIIEVNYDDGDGNVQTYQGTGFYLADVGWVTCAHVVQSDDGVTYTDVSAFQYNDIHTIYEVTVSKIDTHRDIAVLSILEKPGAEFVPDHILPHCNEISQMQPIILMGFPSYGLGQQPYIEEGKVASKITLSGVPQIHITAQIHGGNSGGPILNSDNQAVAMATKGVSQGATGNFAVEISAVLAVARDAPD